MWRWTLALLFSGVLALVTAGCGNGTPDQPAPPPPTQDEPGSPPPGEEEPGS